MKKLLSVATGATLTLLGCAEVVQPAPDRTAPGLELSVLDAGSSVGADTLVSWIRSATLSFVGEATDDVAVSRVTYSVDGGPERDVEITAGTVVPFQVMTSLTAERSVVEVRAYDAAGNRADRWLVTWVDSVPPVFDGHLQAPAFFPTENGEEIIGWHPLPVRLFALRRDVTGAAGALLAGLSYRIDDGPTVAAAQGCLFSSCKDAGYRADLHLAEGSYTLHVILRDMAGNESTRSFPMRIVPLPVATIETPDTTFDASVSSVTVTGRVWPTAGVSLQFGREVQGNPAASLQGPVTLDPLTGRFSFEVPLGTGENRITVRSGMYPLHDWFTFVPEREEYIDVVSDRIVVRREES